MHFLQPTFLRHALRRVMKYDGHCEADRERSQKRSVNTTGTEDLPGSQTTEEDGGGEIGVDTRTGEPILLVSVRFGSTCQPSRTLFSLPFFSSFRNVLCSGRDGCLRLAEIWYARDLEVHDTSADERRDHSCCDLSPKGLTLGNLYVVRQLQVVCEVKGMSSGHISSEI